MDIADSDIAIRKRLCQNPDQGKFSRTVSESVSVSSYSGMGSGTKGACV